MAEQESSQAPEPQRRSESEPTRTRPKGRKGAEPSPQAYLHRDLLIAQYRAQFSALENMRLAYRVLFTTIAIATIFVTFASIEQTVIFSLANFVIGLVWRANEQRRRESLAFLDSELIKRPAKTPYGEKVTDEYIRVRYYTAERVLSGPLAAYEPVLWSWAIIGLAVMRAQHLVR